MQKFKIIPMALVALLAFFALDALYLKYVAGNSAGDQWKNGIYGTVLVGSQPYQAIIAVKTQDGSKELDRFSSYSDGIFRLGLEPGKYLLVPMAPEGATSPHAAPQEVAVEVGKFTEVNIKYDSGIR